MEKSNIEHLRDLIGTVVLPTDEWREEVFEFIDALEKQIDDLRDEQKVMSTEILSLESNVSNLESELESAEGLVSIDCGIGVIEYMEPDNLKLQMIMEDFKEKMEHGVYFSENLKFKFK